MLEHRSGIVLVEPDRLRHHDHGGHRDDDDSPDSYHHR
jgi:hypothetical protein